MVTTSCLYPPTILGTTTYTIYYIGSGLSPNKLERVGFKCWFICLLIFFDIPLLFRIHLFLDDSITLKFYGSVTCEMCYFMHKEKRKSGWRKIEITD
mmetsp:Transcript_13872/g.20690  ORF Transcript_13872/g.20690 Transcript_13872/m.20690 type:complete len:97 (+) Transcript_13872:112-402(+)